MKHKQLGFTIVELLIVIVVVGILAAISIVAYNNIQNSAHDNIVRQDLANIHKGLEMVKVELGKYPGHSGFPSNLKLSRSSYYTSLNHVNYITNQNGTVYALWVISKSGQPFLLKNDGSVTETAVIGAVGTASAVGLDWTDTTNHRIQGYLTSTGWHQGWTLTSS